MGKWGSRILFTIVFSMIFIFPTQTQGQIESNIPECPSDFEYDSENQVCHLEKLVKCSEGFEYDPKFGSCSTKNTLIFLEDEIDESQSYIEEGDPTGSLADTLAMLKSITMCKPTLYDLENDAYSAKNCVGELYSNNPENLLNQETTNNSICEYPGWINKEGKCTYKLCQDGEFDSGTCFKKYLPQICDGWGPYHLKGAHPGWACLTGGYSDSQILLNSDAFSEVYEKGACPQGTKLNVFGHCEASYSPLCPSETKPNAFGNCQATPKCSSGKLNVFGDCESAIKTTCPSGSKMVAGICEKKADCDKKTLGVCTDYSCDSGWKQVVSICTKLPTKTCPSGMHIKGLVCVKTPSCPTGTSLNELNFCIGKLDKVCPDGTSINNIGVCIGLPTCDYGYQLINEDSINTKCRIMNNPPQKPNCPNNTTVNEETQRCEWKASCSDGYVQQDDWCVSITSNCPSGTSFNKSTNRCEITPSCPNDLVFFNNDCVDSSIAEELKSSDELADKSDENPEAPKLHKGIPEWIKDQSEWWLNDAISDREFIQSFEYLIENKIIDAPNVPEPENLRKAPIPAWFKNNVKWWINEQVTDYDFAKGLEHLVKVGVIVIQKNSF